MFRRAEVAATPQTYLVRSEEEAKQRELELGAPRAVPAVRSRRATADISIERDGSVLVRAPEWADDDTIADIVSSKHYWIYEGLAEWRDLNATLLREYKNGEGSCI